DTPRGVTRTDVRSAQQMHDAVMAQLRDVDVFVAVAAVADWRPAEVAQQKLKKANDTDTPTLQFVQNPDILAAVAARADAPYCVGFAAESENLEQYGEQKRKRKGVPLLVGNIGHRTFGLDDNEIVLFDANGMTRLPRADKLSLARELVTAIGQRLPRKPV
ncbi:MAG TPA: phosphopantothenate synthase, partial [Cupriavidus sp.]|nr:phosphopantothenate synthase [Cupriavidus sp.]